MAYATADKIRRRLRALPQADVDAALDEDLADVILDADSVCNAYLAKGGYSVPVTGGAEALRLLANCSSTIAAAYIVRDSFSGGGETESPGLYKTLYDEAIKLLESIAEGELKLPEEAEPEIEEIPKAETVYGTHTAMGQWSQIDDAPFWAEYPNAYYNTGRTGYR